MVDDINKKLDYLNETKQLIRQAIEQKGPIITDEDTLRSYVDKINNIESLDPNTAKIFKDEAEMNQDEKVFIGKKAIIYNRDMMPLNRENRITNIEIPETFVLSEACEQTYSAYYSGNGSNLQIGLNMNDAYLYLQLQTPSGSGYIECYYKSEDGINYTYSSGSHSNKYSTIFGIIEFEYEMIYSGGTWSNLFGDMIKVNNSEFYGLYEYTNKYEDTKYANIFSNFQLDENNNFTYNKTPLYIADIQTKVRNIMLTAEDLTLSSYYGLARITEYEEDVPKTLEIYHNGYPLLYKNKLKVIATSYSTEPTSIPTYTKLVIDLINMTVKEETASTLIETINAEDSVYYIATMKDIENNIPCFKFRVYTSGSSNVMSFNYSYVIESIIFNAYEYNIYYKRPKYTVAPTQLTNIQKNQLFENQIVYGNNGIVKGDKSYLRNIKAQDFIDTWLPGLVNNTEYSYIINNGKYVPYQTFIERNQIMFNDVEDQDTDTCITELANRLDETKTTLNESDTLFKIYKCTQYFTNTYRYNDICYWYAIGINWNNSSTHQTVTGIYGVVYNMETKERIYEMSDTTQWKPIEPNTYQTIEFYSDPEVYRFIPERNEFVILFNTGSWGWSNGAYAAVYRYNVVTKGRVAQASIQCGKHGYGTYYQISEASYDVDNNCFYGVIDGFDTDGANQKSQYIIKLDSSYNSSVVYTDTSITSLTSVNGSFWYNRQNRGPLFSYYLSTTDSKTTKFINLNNSKVLNINGTATTFSNSNFTRYKDEFYILYSIVTNNVTTWYVDKLNITNMTKTNIVSFESTNTHYFYYVNKELCVINNTTRKIYDLSNNYLLQTKYTGSSAADGLRGIVIEDNEPISEAYAISVTTGDMVLTMYKNKETYYTYKEIQSYPIEGELFITVKDGGYTYTKDGTTYMYNSNRLTKQKVNDYQYQKYLDSMDQLLYEEEVEN